MCFDEGTLCAYLDGEMPIEDAHRITAHLAECPHCRQVVARLQANKTLVNGLLDGSMAAAGARPDDLLSAWNGLQGSSRRWKGVCEGMRRFKMAVAVAAVLGALALPFSFPPVRSLAAEFLNVFRVEQVQVVNISPEDIEQVEKALDGQGTVDIESFGRITTSGEPTHRTGVSLAEVQEAVGPGFKVPVLPGCGEQSWGLSGDGSVTIAPDTQAINAMLINLGSEKLLPSSLDGKDFTLHQYPIGTVEAARPDGRMVRVVQGRSPELAVPEGTDMLALRDALLGLPFLPDDVRRQLQAVSDWRNTIMIPSFEGETKSVRVNGTEGAFIDGQGSDNALIWADGGLVYAVSGDGLTLDEALAVGGSLQ